MLTLARVVKPTSVNWEHLATSNILLKEQSEKKVRILVPEPSFIKTAVNLRKQSLFSDCS